MCREHPGQGNRGGQPAIAEDCRRVDAGLEPVVGHRFNLRGDWGGVLDCEVLDVEPGKTLSYTWNFAHDDAAYNLTSVVTFTLTPTRAGTHLRMEQSGFRPDQKQAYGGARVGWQQFFARLEQLLTQSK